jgi:hypothetical protein
VVRVRSRDRVVTGEAGVRLSGEAAELIEQRRVEAVGIPIGKAGLGFVANLERNALLRHFARGPDCVTQLIDLEVVGVGGQRLFVAFQGRITLDAGAGKLSAEAEGHVIARVRSEIVAIRDHVVATATHELVEIGLAQRFDAELLGP